MEGARMFRRNTITVATIAACGVTLALGASVAVQPRFVPPIATVAPALQETLRPADGSTVPHKFMRGLPRTM
jgi:hypothetical protein